MPASVEADGHVRVAASVPVDGARLSGADKGARARPTGHLWRLPCPSGCLSTRCRSLARAGQLVTPGACECVARPASVHGARPCLPAAGLPKGLPPTGHPAARPRGAPRRANSASQLAAARSPARLPLLPPPRPPRPPRPPFVALARATLCSPRGRAPTGPPSPPQPTPLNRDPRARRRRPFSYTYPPTSPGPSSCAQTFPGPNVVPGGGPPAPADRAPPVRPCAPANWSLPFVTRRRRRAGPRGHLGRPTGESPWRWRSRGDRPSPVPPASPEKGVWAPLKRPALPGPLMGGVCQQI
ncbi:hypothetical protein V6Z77_010166 [Aspergillus fumigatus]